MRIFKTRILDFFEKKQGKKQEKSSFSMLNVG